MCTVFATKFGWSHSFPMKESEAHEALSLFQWDGVPPAIICDNVKEMILGKFKRKLKEASCHLRQTEPFTPPSNTAEENKLPCSKLSTSLPNAVVEISLAVGSCTMV